MCISVIMPAYNVSAYLAEAVQSVLAQTFADWELIIVDDNSTDSTRTIAEGFTTDPRVRLITSDTQLGAAGARNLGTAAARFDLLSYFDSDDRLTPTALEVLEAAIRGRPEVGLVYSNYARIDANGQRYGVRRLLNKVQRPSGNVLADFLKQNRMINGGVALVRKALVDRVGGWNPALRSSNDWALWVLIAAISDFLYIPDFIALEYRELPTGISQSINTSFDRALPAINAVYSNPLVTARFSPADLAKLRHSTESHKLSLLAAQGWRRRHYGQALRYLGQSLRRAPADAPRTLAKFALAMADSFS